MKKGATLAGNIGFFALLFICVFLFAGRANAASIYLSPASASYRVGQTFQVGVFVSSTDQAINTCQSTITFPPDKLEVASVSTKSSVFNLMVANPTCTSNKGCVDFSGIVLNPGYTGTRGLLATINFRAKAEGQAKVVISEGQVLANDGDGTDITGARGSGTYTILPKIIRPEDQIGLPVATTAVSSITSTDCSFDYLPDIFLKVHQYMFDAPALWLLLLILMIVISALIYLWCLVDESIRDSKRHSSKSSEKKR